LEEQILRYYLSLFSFLIFIIYLLYIFNFKYLIPDKNILTIDKGSSILKVNNLINENNNFIEKNLYYFSLRILNKFYKKINYGKFQLNENHSFYAIYKIISKKSNIDFKITIIEGWQEFQLTNYLKLFFTDVEKISYSSFLADTYNVNSSIDFEDFMNFQKKNIKNFLRNFSENLILKKYGLEKILIISSLVEKEGINIYDKALIASVIFNRLNKDMKLQIDATVIYSLTEGLFKLDRPLTYSDLRFKHPYNTYVINTLPPSMISIVSPGTIKIVLNSPKSDYFFYFYNVLEKKHIFSKNFNEHKKKLNEYRKNNK